MDYSEISILDSMRFDFLEKISISDYERFLPSNLDYLAPRPPLTAGGSGQLTGKWFEVQRRRTSKTQLSNQCNFLLVCAAGSILLLHTPIPVIQGRLHPAKCITALSVLSWRSLSEIIRAYDALSKHAHSCSGIK